MPDPSISRRGFVQGMALAGGAAAIARPVWSRAAGLGPSVLSGTAIDLAIGPTPVNITGKPRIATAVNGMVPGPTVQLREGDAVTIRVANRLRETSSIHWHGFRLPNDMDGVPGLTFPGILSGETFTYRFPIVQGGTYWYHSHSGMQEQTGLYGAAVLQPSARPPYDFDRDYVVVLSDWTDESPEQVVANLKQDSDYYNYHRRTLGDFLSEARRRGLGRTWRDWSMWADMRMSPTDIMDVTGATYTFLVNGHPPAANWTALFQPGERVRLRFVNASSMTTYDVMIPGLTLAVVAADGSDVAPVEVDEFRIAVAETYDVIVEPRPDRAYTIFAQAEDRSGYARGTLAPRPGMVAPVPPMDPRPVRTMEDMGMGSMSGMGAAAAGGARQAAASPAAPLQVSGGAMAMGAMAKKPLNPSGMPGTPSSGTDMAGMNMPGMNMPGMDMPAPAKPVPQAGPIPPAPVVVNADGVDPRTLRGDPEVDNVVPMASNRLDEPGDGLGGDGRRVLVYAALRALAPDADPRTPDREIQFHLTGNMHRFVWGFDGKTFSESAPVRVGLGERVRFTLINDTMMEHPIHLHGYLFSLENGQYGALPLKHTVNVKPAEKLSFVYTADTPGRWAFHCHLLYHMEAGMFRTVLVA